MTTKVTTDVIAAGAVTATELASTLDLSSKTVTLAANEISAGELAATLDLSSHTVTLAAGEISAAELASTLDLSSKTLTLPATNRSVVVQVVNTQTGAVATGTTVLPGDDTIPQNTEGDQFMTLAVTPTSATNKLKIEVVCHGTHSASNLTTVALFQDTTANALAAGGAFTGAAWGNTITFTHYMDAGTTSSTTFKVRAGGGSAGTYTFNGFGSGRKLGGIMASSITITEIKV